MTTSADDNCPETGLIPLGDYGELRQTFSWDVYNHDDPTGMDDYTLTYVVSEVSAAESFGLIQVHCSHCRSYGLKEKLAGCIIAKVDARGKLLCWARVCPRCQYEYLAVTGFCLPPNHQINETHPLQFKHENIICKRYDDTLYMKTHKKLSLLKPEPYAIMKYYDTQSGTTTGL